MNKKILGTSLFGISALIVIIYTIYKYFKGEEIGLNEIATISVLVMMCLSSLTWGTNQDEDDGILQEEELGQKIIEKSSKISYYLLMFFILIIMGAEQIITGSIHISSLIILGLAIITLPFIEFLVARRYQ